MQTAHAMCMHPQHTDGMPSITVRNVPDDVRDELAARAAREGRSLQEHLLAHLVELARRPTVTEVLARARSRAETAATRLPADRILEHRDAERR
jgi:plasmid stability protein